MVVPSSDLTRVVEQVVARFVQRYSAPPRYDHAEWRAECLGEAWRCGDRQLVEWVWLAGVSQAEAAGRLGVSQQAAAKSLARLRAVLRGKLGGNSAQGGCNLEGCSE